MKVLKSTFVIHSVITAMAIAFTAPIAASDSTTSRIESEPFRGGISVYDSSIYAPLFTTKEMAAIFNDASLIRYWLIYERELAKAEATHNVIPQAAADVINKIARPENINIEELRKATLKVGRPVDGLVKQIRKLDPLAKQYLHFGSTTQDVMDTATVLQCVEAIHLIDRQLKIVIEQIADLAEKYAAEPMIARSNGQDAIPTTYGMYLASYMAELNRNRTRLLQALDRVSVGQFGSAVGTMSSIGPKGLEVRKTLMKNLGLKEADMTWNASRDNYAEVVQILGLINGTIGRIAADLNLWSRTADNSVSEGEGGASSTMPQKRNPRAAEFMGGLAAMSRIRVTGAMEMLEQTEVRQGAPWISEWSTIPEMFMITNTALNRTSNMFAKLIIRPETMRARFNDSQHFVMAEAVQQFLTSKIGLGEAHTLLVKAIKTAPLGTPFEDVLRGTPEIRKLMTDADIEETLNPTNYLGLAPTIVKNAVTKVRSDLQKQTF